MSKKSYYPCPCPRAGEILYLFLGSFKRGTSTIKSLGAVFFSFFLRWRVVAPVMTVDIATVRFGVNICIPASPSPFLFDIERQKLGGERGIAIARHASTSHSQAPTPHRHRMRRCGSHTFQHFKPLALQRCEPVHTLLHTCTLPPMRIAVRGGEADMV